MNPYALAGGVVALVLAFGGGAYLGRGYTLGQVARDEVLIQKAADAAQLAAAVEIGKIKITHRTIHSELEKTLERVPDPDACRIDADTLRLLNDALAGRAPAAGGSVVPEGTPAPDVQQP